MIWALVGFALVQLALNVLIESRHPQIYDDEFTVRLASLQARIAENPDRPLLLMTGSSRCEMGFLPEMLPPLRTPTGERPLAYNFSHLGSGPIFNLMTVQRLIRRGIRPRWLLLEVMPPCLNHEYHSVATTCGELDDLPTIWRYFSSLKASSLLMRNRLFPCSRLRMFLCGTYLPCLATKSAEADLAYIKLFPFGGDAGWQLYDELEPDAIGDRTDFARGGYYPRLQEFQIKPEAEASIHETLQLCRENDIQVVLMLMPEGQVFQSWYAPWAAKQIDTLCQRLSREHDVPLIDARPWLAEHYFFDSHHPMRPGAKVFTQRLNREVIEPLLQGRLNHHQDTKTTKAEN